MPDPEAMPGHRASKASKASAAILGQRAIPDAKALRGMLGHKGRREQPGLQDHKDRKAMSGFKAPEVFQGQPAQPALLAPWAHRV